MIFLVHRPLSGDVVGMTSDELEEFVCIPDHRGLVIKVEMAFPAGDHACEAMIDLEESMESQPPFLETHPR